MEDHDGLCCQQCKPDIRVCGQFDDTFYVAVDIKTNEYWIGDAEGHADLIYKFPMKPDRDPLNMIDEMEDGNDPMYDRQIDWIRKWQEHYDTFVFNPSTGHHIYEQFTKRGWAQDTHGDLFLYVVHVAAVMIETYENELLDRGIGNNEVIEWSKEKLETVENFIKEQNESRSS